MERSIIEQEAEHQYSADVNVCSLLRERLGIIAKENLLSTEATLEYSDTTGSVLVHGAANEDTETLMRLLKQVAVKKRINALYNTDGESISMKFDSVNHLARCVNKLVPEELAVPVLSVREAREGYREILQAGPKGTHTLSAAFERV